MLRNVSDSSGSRMNVHNNARLTPKGREAMVCAVLEGRLSQAAAASSKRPRAGTALSAEISDCRSKADSRAQRSASRKVRTCRLQKVVAHQWDRSPVPYGRSQELQRIGAEERTKCTLAAPAQSTGQLPQSRNSARFSAPALASETDVPDSFGGGGSLLRTRLRCADGTPMLQRIGRRVNCRRLLQLVQAVLTA
jgi:hypothetical protein